MDNIRTDTRSGQYTDRNKEWTIYGQIQGLDNIRTDTLQDNIRRDRRTLTIQGHRQYKDIDIDITRTRPVLTKYIDK